MKYNIGEACAICGSASFCDCEPGLVEPRYTKPGKPGRRKGSKNVPVGPVDPLVYSVEAAVKAGGGAISRTALYMAVKAGDLKMLKRGRRSFIFVAEFRRWLEEMPAMQKDA